MARLVDVELAAAGQRHFGEHTPALILHRSAVDPVLLHLGKESTDVVAHEKERVAGALRLVHRDFSRRQAKDYVAAVIDAGSLSMSRKKARSASGFGLLMTQCAPMSIGAPPFGTSVTLERWTQSLDSMTFRSSTSGG